MKEWLLLLLLVITVIISPTAVTWRPNRGQLQLWTVSSSACTTANLQRGCYCYSSLEPENAHCFEEATVPDNHHRTLNRDRAAWCIQNPWLRWQRHRIVALHCIFQNPNVAKCCRPLSTDSCRKAVSRSIVLRSSTSSFFPRPRLDGIKLDIVFDN
jgi:hypothetical protein